MGANWSRMRNRVECACRSARAVTLASGGERVLHRQRVEAVRLDALARQHLADLRKRTRGRGWLSKYAEHGAAAAERCTGQRYAAQNRASNRMPKVSWKKAAMMSRWET
eukprot:756884-Pleurochrysis_carterae.AAC.2